MKRPFLALGLLWTTAALAEAPLPIAVRYVSQFGSDGVCCEEHDWPECTDSEYCCDENGCWPCACNAPPGNDGLTPDTAKYSIQAALASVPDYELPEIVIIDSCDVGHGAQLPTRGAILRGGFLYSSDLSDLVWVAGGPSSKLIVQDVELHVGLSALGGETTIQDSYIDGCFVSGDVTVDSSQLHIFRWTPELADGTRKGRLLARDSVFVGDPVAAFVAATGVPSSADEPAHVMVRIERSAFATFSTGTATAIFSASGDDSMTVLLFDSQFYPPSIETDLPALLVSGDVRIVGPQRVAP